MIECYINGIASSVYGLYLDETALSVLMTPAPVKDDITNDSRIEHGVRVLGGSEHVKLNERTITIKVAIVASTREAFYELYAKFCKEVLAQGQIDISTIYEDGVVYKCRYKSCEPLTYYNGKIGKFAITLREPNPADREIQTEEGKE